MAKTEAEKAAKKAAKAAAAAPAAVASPSSDKPKDKGSKGKGGITIGAPSSGGDMFKVKDFGESTLLLFTGKRMDTDVTTEQGHEDEVPVGRVVILNPKNPAKPKAVFNDTRVFGRALLTALREAVESKGHTAGKINSVQFSKGKGWVLEADKDAERIALEYLESVDPTR